MSITIIAAMDKNGAIGKGGKLPWHIPSVMRLIKDNIKDLERFGGVGFKIVPFKTKGGMQKREVAILNERQATLLITYLKNTDIVKEFKIRLVSAFYDMAQQIKELKTQILETENKQLSNTINNIILKPHHFTASAVGKMFSISAVRLNDIMFQHGYLRKDRLPIQKYQNEGFFSVAYCEIKHTSGYIEEKPFTKYTEKGVRLVFDTLKKEGIIEEGFRLPIDTPARISVECVNANNRDGKRET